MRIGKYEITPYGLKKEECSSTYIKDPKEALEVLYKAIDKLQKDIQLIKDYFKLEDDIRYHPGMSGGLTVALKPKKEK